MDGATGLRLGWIVHAHDDGTRQEWRDQPPVFEVNGEPIFEVWFWCAELYRWAVMSYVQHPHLAQQGCIYFLPDDTADMIRQRLAAAANA